MASEILSYSLTAGVTNSESVILNGVDGHTYTILSVIVTETAGADETFDLYIDENGGGTDFELLSDQALGANETFIFNDKVVLTVVVTYKLLQAVAHGQNQHLEA